MRIYIYILLLFPFFTFSQIQINEFFADNGECCLDDFDEPEDFIEIINLSAEDLDLAGYYFGDLNGGTVIADTDPILTTIPSGGLKVLWFDEDLDQGLLHIDAKLNNSGESIICINPTGDTIINISYSEQYEDISFASFPDGQVYDMGWDLTMCPSPGESNNFCPMIEGCTSPNADNYNPEASIENGTCVFSNTEGLIINEYGASNCNNQGSECGDYEDWIELYNNSASSIDLNGFYLSDKISSPTKWQITEALVIEPYSYQLIYLSGINQMSANGQYGNAPHTNFKLSQTRNDEYLVLTNTDSQIIFYSNTIPNQLNHSRGRVADAAVDWGIFTSPSPGNSNQNSKPGYTSTPVFDFSPGFYDNQIELSISTEDTGVFIYYTTNGDWPTDGDALYIEIDTDGSVLQGGDPIIINETSVVRAIVYDKLNNNLPSFVETNTYFINSSHTVNVISIAGDQVDNLLNGNQIKPIGSFEMFDVNGDLIDEATGEFNEHGNDSWAYAQRGFDYITRDQHGYNYAIRDEIFREKNRDEFQRLIVKAAANDNYPFTGGAPAHIRDSYIQSLSQVGDLRLDERTHESCILYVNGEYWGVYDFREKVDDLDFTEHYYDQGYGNVDFLKTWGGTWTDIGDNTTQQEWNNLRDFIVDNDMTDADNYQYVKSVYNTGSLIDYFILNSYVVCMDWLNWNTAWWRGKNPDGDKKKWRYALWDMDATFGHYVNYTGIPDTGSGADPCDPEQLGDPGGQGHVPILNSLFENEEFTADYINRYADLSNSTFSCDFMIYHLDSLIAIIEPEMPQQIERWGGNMQQWQDNVQELKDFILERCSDEIVSGMEECYDVEAITLNVIIEGQGDVQLNSIELTPGNTPWEGTYYSGIPLEIEAIPYELVNFYWEVVDGDAFIANTTDLETTLSMVSGPVTLIANFDACQLVESDLIIGPTEVEEGQISQYSFFSGQQNELEWEVTGGEILWTSGFDNTVAIIWDMGVGEGEIIVGAANEFGEVTCFTTTIIISESTSTNTGLNSGDGVSLVVFPNPLYGSDLKIHSTTHLDNCRIVDQLGRQVKDFNLENIDGYHTISLEGLSPGVYLMVLSSDSGVLTETIKKL